MDMKKPSIREIRKGIKRFSAGERPWPEREVDWHIASEDGYLFPLKYIYGLTVEKEPASYTTNQAKSAMRHLGLYFISMKGNPLEGFTSEVEKSILDQNGRKKRLQSANRRPSKKAVVVKMYNRNPDVVAEVLERAKGCCQKCNKPAPFNRKANGKPYLEVHHKKQLANGGEDSVENAIALCPNCHREAHYG